MNQFINFFWTIICFAPVVTYWARAFDVTWSIVTVVLSVGALFIPSNIIQLSNQPQFYESIGTKIIRRFVQNGEYANRWMRRRNPKHRLIRNRVQALSYYSTLRMYERFHIFCFFLFLVTDVIAVLQGFFFLSGLILIGNIIYNICPILLQQYNKARLVRVSKSIV